MRSIDIIIRTHFGSGSCACLVFVEPIIPAMHATTATEGFVAEWKPAMQATKAMKAAMKATKTKAMMAIAEQTELKPKSVKAVFGALVEIANAEVKKTEKFAIPHLVTLKLKHKPATKAGKRMMFGKEVKVAAKPARKIVKAFPAKALKDSI